MQAADTGKTTGKDDFEVLEIALAPAAVAFGIIDQGGWQFLVAFGQLGTSQTSQPARRSKAASTKSWLKISPPKGSRPDSFGNPQ